MSLYHIRENYDVGALRRSDLSDDPVEQFEQWFGAAHDADCPSPNAMTLSTISPDGWPEGRVVLLRGVGDRGFEFYTNLASTKARSLAAEPRAALTFLWQALHRQVRVTGYVSSVSTAESDAYFASRPRLSQLGAWASKQSEVLANRETLETQFQECWDRFEGTDVPRPAGWGGYRLEPRTFEFWQGRPNRLHDRLRYRRLDEGWQVDRLSP